MGLRITLNIISYENIKTYVQYLIVAYVSYIHKVIRILICTSKDRCKEMLYVFCDCHIIISTCTTEMHDITHSSDIVLPVKIYKIVVKK